MRLINRISAELRSGLYSLGSSGLRHSVSGIRQKIIVDTRMISDQKKTN
jgi:hypothetical protein